MDSITHIALGASIGEVFLGRKCGFKAALFGAFISTLPDLDVILYLFYSKYEMLSIHRGMSHSILFCTFFSVLLAIVLKRLHYFKFTNSKTLSLFIWICLMSHLLLDTSTAYGTQLLLPFSNRRIGLDSINVVDPLYTIPLLIGLILGIWIYREKPKQNNFVHWGIALSSLYLIFTFINKQRIEQILQSRFDKSGIQAQALMTMPVGFANYNWYGVAKTSDSIYLQKYVPFESQKPIDAFPINEHYLSQLNPKVADKMRWFAKGFYTVDQINEKTRIYNLQVDMRGVVKVNEMKNAPTIGFFEVEEINGEIIFTSGRVH